MSQIEQEYKEVKANLQTVSDNLKSFAEEAQKATAKHQQLSEETKAKVDELLTKQGELNARLSAAEQAIVDHDNGNHSNNKRSTMGQKVVNDESFKSMSQKLISNKGSFSVNVQSAITSSNESAGDLVVPHRVAGVVAPPEQRLTIRDLISGGRTTSNAVEFVQETGFTNNANVVSENPTSGKPQSELVFAMKSAPVATIAHWIHASKQILSDAGMLQSYIDGRLRYGLKLKEEAQLLKGSGVDLNINGIFTQATTYVNPGVVVPGGETNIDRLRIAMLQVQLAEYSADGIVLNPIDWATIELTKDTTNRYLFANPQALSGPVLWGLPVVATQSLDQSEFLTGAFQLGAQVWDREDTTVTISTEDRDNFIKNMVTILCEERLALTVYRPEAFVKGEFLGEAVSG